MTTTTPLTLPHLQNIMEFRDTGPDSLNFLDLDIASEIANLETTTRTLEMGWGINKGSGVDAQGGPAAPRIVGHNPGGYQPVGGTFGGFGSLDASALRGLETWKTSPNANTQNMLTLAQNSSRAARNGREQQRAQKISEFIDKLKVRNPCVPEMGMCILLSLCYASP